MEAWILWVLRQAKIGVDYPKLRTIFKRMPHVTQSVQYATQRPYINRGPNEIIIPRVNHLRGPIHGCRETRHLKKALPKSRNLNSSLYIILQSWTLVCRPADVRLMLFTCCRSEVAQFYRTIRRNQQIFDLQVAMNNFRALCVHMRYCPACLIKNATYHIWFERRLSSLKDLHERAPCQKTLAGKRILMTHLQSGHIVWFAANSATFQCVLQHEFF